MLGKTVTMSKEQLIKVMKNMDNELKGLEERSHIGEKFKRSEMTKFKMLLSILEILL